MNAPAPKSAQSSLASAIDSGLLTPNGEVEPVLVMCSAGRDSHSLLDIAVKVLGADNVHVMHVNYGLRDGALGDEENIEARCEQLGVPCEVIHAEDKPESGNMHQWARDLRLDGAAQIAFENGIRVIATAHTLTDQVETALARLAGSHGRKALTGMHASRPIDGTGITLVRPLFSLTRADTAAYCDELGLAYRDDPSNDDPKYTRARVRNQVVPAMQSIHPSAEFNIARTLAVLDEEREALDAVVQMELGDDNTISQERLAQFPPALGRLVLRAICERALGKSCPKVVHRLDEVVGLAKSLDRRHAFVKAGNGALIALNQKGIISVSKQCSDKEIVQ